jgi:threonine synthase
MDVAKPSNFVRILEIFEEDYLLVREHMDSISVTDEETARTMKEVYEERGYVLDPHGAVAYAALRDFLAMYKEENGFFLETAHPVKFDCVNEILGTVGEVPASVAELESRKIEKTTIPADYEVLSSILAARV